MDGRGANFYSVGPRFCFSRCCKRPTTAFRNPGRVRNEFQRFRYSGAGKRSLETTHSGFQLRVKHSHVPLDQLFRNDSIVSYRVLPVSLNIRLTARARMLEYVPTRMYVRYVRHGI